MITIGSDDAAERAAGAVVEVAVIAPPEKFAAASDDPTRFDWMMDANRLHVYRESWATEASGRVERLMRHSLEQYLEREAASVADEICQEAFGITLPELMNDLGDADEEQLSTEPLNRPQTFGVRRLAENERIQLFAQMSQDWQSVLSNSSKFDFEINDDIESGGRRVRRLVDCCKSHRVAISVTTALVTAAVVGGCSFYGRYLSDHKRPSGHGITADTLAELRAPEDICGATWNDTALRFARPVSQDSWREAGWCNGYSGKLVCGTEKTLQTLMKIAMIPNAGEVIVPRGLRCYNFQMPSPYDLPTVWEAVAQYDTPERCAVVCDTIWTRRQHMGRYIAKRFGIPLTGMDLTKLDEEVLRRFTLDTNCSRSAPDINPDPQCNCAIGILGCYVRDPRDKEIQWGDLLDFNTNQYTLSRHVSNFNHDGYNVSNCIFDCYQKQDTSGSRT
ncbi:hypothetical protein GNI_147170 [Gregarina niphandrodes]|uniref:Uncharacterized protein n=1 Tax=Gregarina niphandrodes TaxID=110365 RepID=A0A023B085_GRENI|nr:hypothetical protein GNI_147170 [Gregarina niphandrodes]EZG44455.1 hypothetical protein GNI_147170 [Gregarina niphandrodes]|eukprot:XP_011134175.1 hypothetical protein GNI_147170 [Gregarina niphandrodes]